MIEIDNLGFQADKFKLKNISFNVAQKEYFVLLGPTGSGKTSLIKCIAGLYKPTSGKVIKNRNEITNILPEKRNIGYVPQRFALFPHMDVQDNIEFGMKIRGTDAKEIKTRLGSVVEWLKIAPLLKREIDSLSGGEKQKVSLARAVVVRPDLLLLDEPFASIEESFRKKLWFELKKFLSYIEIPVIHITHNLDEACALGEKVGILINGELKQTGSVTQVLDHPCSKEIASFLGYNNIFKGTVVRNTKAKSLIRTDSFDIKIINRVNIQPGDQIEFCIRQQDLKIIRENYPI
ncbi:MAG: ATP-binding cassette domain-containing protein, partial [Spirochaetes bacterium]|nr:ATP-binding cassette domain-containing protein [Spirochaetota bacterium]